MKKMIVTITNKGCEIIETKFRGTHQVTVLEILVKDEETGEVLNAVTSHSAVRDTINILGFYDENASGSPIQRPDRS